MNGKVTKDTIKALVCTAVEAFAAGFKVRHNGEVDAPTTAGTKGVEETIK